MNKILNKRPAFHYTNPNGWLNDPNGLIYHDGVFHLYYQHYPDEINWGPMHWGHALTKDFYTYETKQIALYPDKMGYIFSGSMVEDTNNSAGFGAGALVAVFTYHQDTMESQGIAYSLDHGDTFTKYSSNPIIQLENARDFRDPKVFWHQPISRWVMLVVAYDRVVFYTSDNLKEWERTGEFIPEEGFEGVLECPDLFRLKTNGNEETYDVLTVSVGEPSYGTKCYIGTFDGKVFSSIQKKHQWIDLGMDYYAAVTYNGISDQNNSVLAIGWQSNWYYARQMPADTWRGIMTIPRAYELIKKDGNILLTQKPYEEIDKLFGSVTTYQSDLKIPLKSPLAKLSIPLENEKKIEVFLEYVDEIVIITLDKVLGVIELDRSHTSFQNQHYLKKQTKALIDKNTADMLDIYLDYNTLDVFVSDGSSMTSLIFTENDATDVIYKGEQSQGIMIAYLNPLIDGKLN